VSTAVDPSDVQATGVVSTDVQPAAVQLVQPHLGRGVGEGAVQTDEHGKRSEGWEAPRKRVEVSLLVQARGLHLQAFRVVGVHRLGAAVQVASVKAKV
jgi:hypothetical protein